MVDHKTPVLTLVCLVVILVASGCVGIRRGPVTRVSQEQMQHVPVFDRTLHSAMLGNADAQNSLGQMYSSGHRVSKNNKKAIKWFLMAAKQGDAVGQYNIGLMYNRGAGVLQDYKKAVYWYTKAAEQELARGQNDLGVMYETGKGVPQDYKKAVYWYTKAAEQGYASARFNLGLMYELGKGVPKDYKKAVHWYSKAAEQRNRRALNRLAGMGFPVEGAPEDYRKSADRVSKATAKGNLDYQYSLGRKYEDGKEVPQDYKKAFEWYSKAAEQEDARAQYRLGLMYEHGRGIPQDYKKAMYWYAKPAEHGVTQATTALKRVLEKIREGGQVAENQKRKPPKKAKIAKKPRPKKKPRQRIDNDKVLAASSGTGFIVSENGHLITNNHVISGCDKVKAHHKGRDYPSTVIATDPVNDLALLETGLRPRSVFPLSNANAHLMQDVFVAGFPFGKEISSSVKITRGIVSSLTGFGNNYSNMQIDAALQPGNSGGPVMDDKGNVVGVAVAKLSLAKAVKRWGVVPEGTNFGIKSSVVRNLMESNDLSPLEPRTSSITKPALAKKVRDGTLYLSCWMTYAKIKQLKAQKVMFTNFE